MQYIIGVDEVGRGAWAGPLTVGAVALKIGEKIDNLRDSKKLSQKNREKLSREIKIRAAAIGVGFVPAKTIDQIGMTQSLKNAAEIAFQQIPAHVRENATQIILDGNIKLLSDARATTMIKADDRIQAVSAASVIAKVFRDNFMTRVDAIYPDFQFAHHVGYGTKNHAAALEKFGPIKNLHRFSFRPIANYAQLFSKKSSCADSAVKTELSKISQTSGRIAENLAAEFLRQQDYQIIAQNWRTKFCEIDIVAQKNHALFFVEVKFRENNSHGDGFAAVTEKKLRQMRKAAEIFIAENPQIAQGKNLHLSAISLSENPPQIDEFLPDIF